MERIIPNEFFVLLTKEDVRRIIMSLKMFGRVTQRINIFLDSSTNDIILRAEIFQPDR